MRISILVLAVSQHLVFTMPVCAQDTELNAEERLPKVTSIEQFADSVVDLTHPLSEDIPVFPGSPPMKIRQTTSDTDSYFLNRLELDEHTGTHVDAPVHFTGRKDVAQLPLPQLICPLVVVDVRKSCSSNADYEVTVDDLKAWESIHGRMPQGALVAVWTGWDQKWNKPVSYVNEQEDGKPHFPGLSEAAAQYLAQHCLIAGLAIDTLSVDPGVSDTFPVHTLLLARELFHVENLANLNSVQPSGFAVMVLPLPIQGGSGSPARVIAFPASQLKQHQ